MAFGKKKKTFSGHGIPEIEQYKRPMRISIGEVENGYTLNYCKDNNDESYVFDDANKLIEQLKKWMS